MRQPPCDSARRASRAEPAQPDCRRAPLPGVSAGAAAALASIAAGEAAPAGRRASRRTLAGTSQTTRSRGCRPISARRLRTRSTAALIELEAARVARELRNLERVGPVRGHDRLAVVRKREPDLFADERRDRMQQPHCGVPNVREHRRSASRGSLRAFVASTYQSQNSYQTKRQIASAALPKSYASKQLAHPHDRLAQARENPAVGQRQRTRRPAASSPAASLRASASM